jgi:hypothetical protein
VIKELMQDGPGIGVRTDVIFEENNQRPSVIPFEDLATEK